MVLDLISFKTDEKTWRCLPGGGGGGGGTCQNFDRDARPIFLGLKFGQILFFWVGIIFLSIFLGFAKLPAIFLGLPIFISHTWILWMKNTILKNKIILAFHIYSNFDNHCILSHSIFLGLNFGAFFFWEVEICSRTSIPVKEMLVCLPGRCLIYHESYFFLNAKTFFIRKSTRKIHKNLSFYQAHSCFPLPSMISRKF